MSLVYDRNFRDVPRRVRPSSSPTLNTQWLDTTDDEIHYNGHVELEDPFGGSKTISSAGGGSIAWIVGSAVTFANAGSTYRFGIQDMSTTTNPGQGDGTFDVYGDMVGGTDTFTANAVNDISMTSGTKTIAQGDLLTIAAKAVSRAGSDTVRLMAVDGFRDLTFGNMPAVVVSESGGAFAKQTSTPSALITFDDGTLGMLRFTSPLVSLTIAAYNVNTGTADEYGNLITLTSPAYLSAFATSPGSVYGSAADFEFILYSDPLGTPVAEHTLLVDSTQSAGGTFGTGESIWSLPTPVLLDAGTYAVTTRPTTTTNIETGQWDAHSADHLDLYGPVTCYAVRRLNDTGAFADFNGGTAKTRRMEVSVILSGGDDGAGGAGGVAAHSGLHAIDGGISA